jgi:mannose-6-phosphate isomerase-like protein (cupin superfamily)
VADLAYIPAGEVHGTVNQTEEEATLISFQSPPDTALYRGERDPAVTGGAVPKPPPGHVSQVQIRTLASGERIGAGGPRMWMPVGPWMGAQEMTLSYCELEPGASLSVSAAERAESVWFVWSGEVLLGAGDAELEMPERSAVFVPPGQSQTIANVGEDVARLIRCQAPPE